MSDLFVFGFKQSSASDKKTETVPGPKQSKEASKKEYQNKRKHVFYAPISQEEFA